MMTMRKQADLAARAGTCEAILLLAALLALLIAPGQREVALCKLLPSWDVVQCPELNHRVVAGGCIKVVISGNIGHAVMVQQGCLVKQSAASYSPFALYSRG